MKINIHPAIIITILSATLILASCTPKEYITSVDLESLDLKKTGITEKENAEMGKIFFGALIDNTVDKYIPSTTVFDQAGEEYDLADLINGKTIIISSDPYCAAGKASILEDFPKVQEKLKEELKDVNLICLAIREEDDDHFKHFISDLQKQYQQIYIIDNKQALSINMLGAAQYFVNKKGVVKKISFGTASEIEYFVHSFSQGIDLIK